MFNGSINDYPLQYSCLGNCIDRGVWRAIVHGVTKSWTQLSTHNLAGINFIVWYGVKVKVKVTQVCLTLCDPIDYTVHGIFQARILEWVAIPFSRSSQPRDWTQVSHIADRFFTVWAMSKCSVQFSSVTQSCLTLCNPMNHSSPGLPVHHQLPEFTQTHVHRVSDAIQPSHPLSFPSPPAPNPSQHQSFPMSQL